MRVAVDVMTGELGVAEAAQGIFAALKSDPELQVLAVGKPQVVEPCLRGQPYGERLQLVPADEMIGMDEEPGPAFKAKKNASVSVAARLVKEGKADAALSPGNTGASMTAATLVLGRIEGVRRPAILTLIPTATGKTGLLDSGAVVDCRAEDLMQWAVMGSVYMKHARGVGSPRVGLLSIGEEEHKGNAQTHEAYPMLKAAPIRFIGNVEGRDLFNGHCDVAVCDGFVGNVALKCAEGAVKLILGMVKDGYANAGPAGKLGGLLSKPMFKGMRQHLNPDQAGGGALLGVAGVFVITHGAANRVMTQNAIRVAAESARKDLSGQLAQAFAGLNTQAAA